MEDTDKHNMPSMTDRERLKEITKMNEAITVDMLQWADDQVLMNALRNTKADVDWLIDQLEQAWAREEKLVGALYDAEATLRVSGLPYVKYEEALATHAKLKGE